MRFICCLFLSLVLVACQTEFDEPIISLDAYQIEEGFTLEAIAAEPLLKAPVALNFDSKGRIWVAQMPGYMNDMQGTGETKPTGSIVILEDLDKDGVMDHSKVFLDSLVMPRALAHVYGGLLYAEPPNLYFVEIENDKPRKRVLVDSLYAASGNPEHQPNGLLMNIDNWIYNAKSHFRYQKRDGVWIKEPTSFRGQWGITHDDFGRLYYNDNSRQLLGDYILPNRLVRNRYHAPKIGVNQLLTNDQRVYPLQVISVNRGYAEGILNSDSLLINVTAACGPLVYRGGVFSEAYHQNVFVCVPEANLIKRNILSFTGDSISTKQAWQDKEFLASTDEGFRPVSLYNGPDGSMYIVDMHRGVIGHHAYLSPYFKEKIQQNRLDTIVNGGRVLKVRKNDRGHKPVPDLDTMSGTQLVQLLNHKNGWIRDRAQHHLIYKNKKKSIPALEDVVRNSKEPLAQIHALYTLEGLNALPFDLLVNLANTSTAAVSSHAIVLLEQFVHKDNVTKTALLFENLMQKNEVQIDLYLATTVGVWANASQEKFFPIIHGLLKKYNDSVIFQEALLSGMQESAEAFLNYPKTDAAFEGFDSQLKTVIEQKNNKKGNSIFFEKSLAEDDRTKGAKLYIQICASCHGVNGQGIQGLAPPLMNSEYTDEAKRLALIILHGLEGPVHVNGKLYELNQAMPGLGQNEAISDKDITDIIAYVTNAFSDVPTQLKVDQVKELRRVKSKSGAEFIEKELIEFVKQTQDQ